MEEIHDQGGHLVAKYESKTGFLEAREHGHRYFFNLLPGQSAGIESRNSLTVVTRLGDAAFTVGHHSRMMSN